MQEKEKEIQQDKTKKICARREGAREREKEKPVTTPRLPFEL